VFSSKHYVPILKGKPAEFEALRTLDPALRSSLTPVIEITPPEYDFAGKAYKTTPRQHLLASLAVLQGGWPVPDRLFLDLAHLDSLSISRAALHPVVLAEAESRRVGLVTVPVTSPSRTVPFHEAVRRVIRRGEAGVCFRLTASWFEDATTVKAVLQNLLRYYAVVPDAVDLILDLRALPSERAVNPASLVTATRDLLASLPHLARWRSLTLAAGSFPATPSAKVKADTIGTLPRREWSLWHAVRTTAPRLKRSASFADYAIQHPDLVIVDPRVIKPSASIRYSDATDWIIFRGRQLKDNPGQFPKLAKQLTRHASYAGPTFSAGDAFADVIARGGPGGGTLKVWRTAGTSHHLSLVARQIASLPVI
jgi:hypothetical protein